MTPPEAPDINAGNMPPAVSSCLTEASAIAPSRGKPRAKPLQVLKARRDFVAASRARRQATKGMIVQARRRPEGHPAEGIRVGFTCSKKVGNAVARNRAKRRLREVARALLPRLGEPGWDYVLIGRQGETIARPYDALLGDMEYAMKRLHADRKSASS